MIRIFREPSSYARRLMFLRAIYSQTQKAKHLCIQWYSSY